MANPQQTESHSAALQFFAGLAAVPFGFFLLSDPTRFPIVRTRGN
jgi:hypothetical protein